MKHRMLIAAMATLVGYWGASAQQRTTDTDRKQGASDQRQTSDQYPQSKTKTKKGESTTGTSERFNARLSASDRRFITEAAHGGMFEVELGREVASKATNDDVKQFAQRMVDDHGKANDQLKKLAGDKGVDVPSSLDAKHKAEMDRITKLSGAELDKSYMSNMLRDHEKDVREFRHASEQATDPEVKSFASSTLPTLEEHLRLAKETAPKVGVNAGRSSETSGSAERQKKGYGKKEKGESSSSSETKK